MSAEHVKPLHGVPSDNTLTAKNLQRMVATSSLEVLAHDIVRRPSMVEQIARGTDVFIPYPPNGTWNETLHACRLLQTNGCRPIPHLPARRVRNRTQLIEWVKSLEELEVRSVLLIAGDISARSGAFKDSLAVLETNLLAEYGINQVSVAAYPDVHPHIPTNLLEHALYRKLELARDNSVELRVVTQFGFDALPLLEWFTKVSAWGMSFPVSVGVAGPSKMRTLLTFAVKCGVRHSINNLMANPRIVRMLGQWDPLEVLSPIAEYVGSNPTVRIENAHIFTFGGLRRTLEWRDQILSRLDSASPNLANE